MGSNTESGALYGDFQKLKIGGEEIRQPAGTGHQPGRNLFFLFRLRDGVLGFDF
jgi:hypothetical protein